MVESCGAENLGALIGKPTSALQGVALPEAVRVITPGSRVTADYSPTRLNIYVDDKGIITAMRCG